MNATTSTERILTRKISGVESAALLCPGPSLPTTWHDDIFDDFGMVVGVNTVAKVFRVHYMFGVDRHIVTPVLERKQKMPEIALVTSRVYCGKAMQSKIGTILIDRILGPKSDPKRPPVVCAWTMPNALKFCLDNAKRVEIHGMDFAAGDDFSGQRGCHKPIRWHQESDWLKKVWVKDRITVYGRVPQVVLEYIAGERKAWPL